jgi:hypothetical protein
MALMMAGVPAPAMSTEPEAIATRLSGPLCEKPSDSILIPLSFSQPSASAIS